MPLFTLTSDVEVDKSIILSMSPHKPAPFKDLLAGAQKSLNTLARSHFFRRFIAKSIAENGGGCQFVRIVKKDHSDHAEYLVLTHEFELLFWHIGVVELFYPFGSRDLDEDLVEKATPILERMQNPESAMRCLFEMFGAPSFSVNEIERETQHNGKMNVVMISDNPLESLHEAGELLREKLAQLQFDSTVLDCPLDMLLSNPRGSDGDNAIFVLELRPGEEKRNAITTLFEGLPVWMTRRLIIHTNESPQMYLSIGYTRQILYYPSTTEVVEMKQENLLQILNEMFAD